eukprot:2438861-Rhodomonas_salina.1
MQSRIATIVLSESVCKGNVIHADPAVTFRHVPAAHCETHVELVAPSDPFYPMLQVQSVIASLPTRDNVLVGHARQTDTAVEFCDNPASHSKTSMRPTRLRLCTSLHHAPHAAPSNPLYPLVQMQSEMSSLRERYRAGWAHETH